MSVSNVSKELTAMGIECSSEAAKVARVLKFDKDLSILFWLVSAFSLAGGGAALALSLYGAIDRRKRDYAMLRTLGLPRSWLVFLPLIESITVAVSAFFFAMLVYHLNAAMINRLFSHLDEDRPGFCYLPPNLQALVMLCSLGLAICGALAAAARLLSISPSNAIRHA
jgi:ABC-type antimicrobial peptide transport system permease subunit